MTYTLPQRNGLIEQIVALETELCLSFSRVVSKTTAELEAKRDDLQAQVDIKSSCQKCGDCGC